MMRVLVVDDEAESRRRLLLMLEELDIDVVGEAANGVEALNLARELRPEVMLLDIVMPEVDGIDVARHLAPPRPLIIFQTGHDQYALSAFENDAVDYVLKPVTLERLSAALDRARRRLAAERRPELTYEALSRLQDGLAAPARRPRLLVREGAGHRLVEFKDIIRFVAKDHFLYAVGDFGERLVDYRLADVETRTFGSFVRVGRSDLLNLDAVQRIEVLSDGSAKVRLSDGTHVMVGRRRVAALREALER